MTLDKFSRLIKKYILTGWERSDTLCEDDIKSVMIKTGRASQGHWSLPRLSSKKIYVEMEDRSIFILHIEKLNE